MGSKSAILKSWLTYYLR